MRPLNFEQASHKWDFFIKHLANNHTTSDARLFITFNPEPNGELYTQKLVEFFKSKGAEIDGERVCFKDLNVFRNA